MEKDTAIGTQRLASLFDAGTFAEVGAYIKREDGKASGATCGYGAVNGKLVFAFAQDSDREKGAFDRTVAKKLHMLYESAMRNGAPIVGVFDSIGAYMTDGADAMAAYGSLLADISRASGVIPQIALIDGVCAGLSATAAAMFDLTVTIEGKSQLFIGAPFLTGKTGDAAAVAASGLSAVTAKDEADAKARAKAEHDRIAAIGAERLRRIMPDNVQGVIVAELNETEYTDPSYECRETRSVRTVILGFSTTSRNGFGELRKAAANLPETAYLAEYNKDYELRYPGFTLGKSPSYGWSIHKMTHYTREGFIDALAYIAGDENNIRLSSPKPERTPEQEQGQTSVQGDFILVNYSEKAIALFGDTKPIKDALSDLGGRFNGRLTYRGEKCAGWIFPKAKEMQVRELIGMTE